MNVLKRNSIRLAEVWMDDYKKYYYERIGNDLGELIFLVASISNDFYDCPQKICTII